MGGGRRDRTRSGHLGKVSPLLQVAQGLLGFGLARGADMGQAQHPIPLTRRKTLPHLFYREIYIREDGPHGVLVNQFFAPFPLPLAGELRGLLQPPLPRLHEHQFHVDHGLQVEAPRLEALFGVAVVGGGLGAELAQICEPDRFVADPSDHVAIHFRLATAPPQRREGDSHNDPSEHR